MTGGLDRLTDHQVHDLIGVGLGPFGLALAAQADGVDGLDAVFCDARPDVAWHPGLLLEGATLQVPFLADLVSLVDPTSRWSYLSYLRERGRLFRFYLSERFQVPRAEYDDYLRWTAASLPSCRLGVRVDALEWEPGVRRRIDALAPVRIVVPSDMERRIEYAFDDVDGARPPVLAVKLQELFGLADTPRIVDGRVPLTLHLLSPGGRPLQVTQDLRGFWDRTYPDVRKEMKGRYPRHPWPDDPWSAAATHRAKPRGT